MPIRPELRHLYGPTWRKETRPAILLRAGYRCEHCGKPDREQIETITGAQAIAIGARMLWRHAPSISWIDHHGRLASPDYNPHITARTITVVLTVAHLNHVAGDDRPENLRALCQWCHLALDRSQHAVNRRSTALDRHDQARPLLAAIAKASQM